MAACTLYTPLPTSLITFATVVTMVNSIHGCHCLANTPEGYRPVGNSNLVLYLSFYTYCPRVSRWITLLYMTDCHPCEVRGEHEDSNLVLYLSFYTYYPRVSRWITLLYMTDCHPCEVRGEHEESWASSTEYNIAPTDCSTHIKLTLS